MFSKTLARRGKKQEKAERGRSYWLGVGLSEPKVFGRVMSHSYYNTEERAAWGRWCEESR